MMDKKQIEAIWPNIIVEERIGKGSFGEVYRVCRKNFDRLYYSAVKVIEIPQEELDIQELRRDGMDEDSIRGYYQGMMMQLASEIDLMESLKTTPNVVTIEDFCVRERTDQIGWVAYIRMELLENLNDYWKRCGISPRQVAQLGVDICMALECCEEKHIIHRDIKPANIFVTEFGDFKLGDFGVSRQVWLSSVRSQKGTSAYMAPEVARGESYDKTIDLYSLGIVLYRLLNDNRLPFLPPAPQPVRYEDHQRAVIKRLSGADMPQPVHGGEALGAIVCRACAYRPEERYPSAGDLKAALLEWMSTSAETVQTAAETPIPEDSLPPVQELSQEPSSSPEPVYETQALLAANDEHPDVIQDGTQALSTGSQPEPSQAPGQEDDVRLAGEETVGLFEIKVPTEAEPTSEQPPIPVQELSQESISPEGPLATQPVEETIGLFETTILPKAEPAPQPLPAPEPEPILEKGPEPEPPEPAVAPEKERLWPRWRTLAAVWALWFLERLFMPVFEHLYLLHIVFLLIAVLLVDGLEAEGGWQEIVARWKDRSRTKRRLAAFVLLLLGFC